ncbi:type II secretion system F family protein [Zhihengliuella salsuginis]|uniref:Tight adherence protein B n=1 Tax=Zhihengliuella salsuginis TaxID=578222 RepID=A0ABQ3GEV2_9MICC|nr:hypothetical protein [Zhihengliuella salsuginis]GHD02916.1 hypothetical protein GCM10008096_08580 [Zhihengliuella salsuginis]
MSGAAIAAATLAAAAAAWVLGGTGASRRSRGTSPRARPRGGASPSRALARWRDAVRREPQDIAEHARALRQLAALFETGRTPERTWNQLGRAWAAEAPPARTGRQDGSGDAGAAGTRAARDIHAAAVAAQTAHAVGQRTSTGLGGHAEHSDFGWVWERVSWCLELSERTGASLAGLLERVAEQLESEQDLGRARATALAGPRTTNRMLALLPAFGLALAALLGADPVGVLIGHPAGRIALVTGAGLWAAHWWWTRRLLRAAGGEERR